MKTAFGAHCYQVYKMNYNIRLHYHSTMERVPYCSRRVVGNFGVLRHYSMGVVGSRWMMMVDHYHSEHTPHDHRVPLRLSLLLLLEGSFFLGLPPLHACQPSDRGRRERDKGYFPICKHKHRLTFGAANHFTGRVCNMEG